MTKYCKIPRPFTFGLSLQNIEKSLNVSQKAIIKGRKLVNELFFS